MTMRGRLRRLWHWITGRQSSAQILRGLEPCHRRWIDAGVRERRW